MIVKTHKSYPSPVVTKTHLCSLSVGGFFLNGEVSDGYAYITNIKVAFGILSEKRLNITHANCKSLKIFVINTNGNNY